MGHQKNRYWKFAAAFAGIILLGWAALIASQIYRDYQGRERVRRLADALKQAGEESNRRALADTIGGKTPRETLRLYIDAVENGDYVLASKYFLTDYQEKEYTILIQARNTPQQKVDEYIATLKHVLQRGGKYSPDSQYFSFDGDVLVRMRLYPRGNWKIVEI